MPLPIDTSPAAMQAQRINAQYNAANAPYNAESAAAMVVLQNTNPSLYLQATSNAAAADAAREAMKRETAFSQPRTEVRSDAFNAIQNQYAQQHNAIVGSGGVISQTPEAHANFILQPGYVTNTPVVTPTPAGLSGAPSTPNRNTALPGPMGMTVTSINRIGDAPVLDLPGPMGTTVTSVQGIGNVSNQPAPAPERMSPLNSGKGLDVVGFGLLNVGMEWSKNTEDFFSTIQNMIPPNPLTVIPKAGLGFVEVVPQTVAMVPLVAGGAYVFGRDINWGISKIVPTVTTMAESTVTRAITQPERTFGNVLGMFAIPIASERVLGSVYNAQPYRLGIERANIIPSSGEGGARAGYSSLALTKMSGQDYQIAQISKSFVGVGGKTLDPIETVLTSDLLKSTTNARFATEMNTFVSSDAAMARFYEVSSKPNVFYHVTPSGDFVEGLISRGSAVVGGANKEGALFFGQPNTILTQYAKGGGVPVALRLTGTPEITPKFLEVVGDIKSGKGAYGTDFAKTSAQLPEGFYPGLRAAAGKAYGSIGLEEEYIISPKTELYLKSARSIETPSGQKWLLVDVSLNKPILPDVRLGIAQAVSNVAELKPFVGIPKVPEKYFKFESPEITFAPQTPLEVSIAKNIAPETALRTNLGYGIREITTGSGARLEQATTAIDEVVKARNFPNPNKVTEAILQTEIDYNVQMYGSSIQKGVGTEQGIITLTRPPNDIDLYVPGLEGKSMGLSFAEDVTKAINKASGRRVVMVDESGTVSLVDGSGKLFDIHNQNPTVGELLLQGSNPNKPVSPYYGMGMKTEPFLETPEGIGVMTYSEQIGRKLSGVSELTLEPRTVVSKVYEGGPGEFSVTGRMGPRFEGRMKDIPDYYTGEKGNIALMERSENPLTRSMANQANTMLEQWLDTWGEPAAKSIRENYQEAVLSKANNYGVDLSNMAKGNAGIPSQGYLIGAGFPNTMFGQATIVNPVYGKSTPKPGPSGEISLYPYESPSEMFMSRGLDFSTSPSREVLSLNVDRSQGRSAGAISREILSLNIDRSQGKSASAISREGTSSGMLSGNASQSVGIRSIDISPDISPSPEYSMLYSPSSPPSGSPPPSPDLSPYLSIISLLPSPSASPSPGSPGPLKSPGSPVTPGSPPPYSPPPSQRVWPWETPSSTVNKKKRKPESYKIFREILPVITPIEEMGGFRSGRSFFRAIGNQQILEVKPQTRDYLHYVDVDQDIRELQQKEVKNQVSDMAGVNFFRTATKQEKAKTGKPIMSYTPTQQEISMAKMVGFGSGNTNKPKKGRRNVSWF